MKKTAIIILLSIVAMATRAQVVSTINWIKYTSQRGSVTNGPTAIDANNNVYTTGYTGTSPSACNILTQKRDSMGTLIYSSVYNNGNFDKGNAIKINGTDAYIAGVSFDMATNNDYIVLKYSSTGSQVWSYRYDMAGLDDEAIDIKVDASGNIYVTGKAKNSSGNYDIVTIKLNPSGTPIWTNIFNGTSSLDDAPISLVLIGTNVYIAGFSTDGTTGKDILVYGIDGNTGMQTWKTTINGTSNTNDVANAMIISGGDLVICGEIDNTGNLDACTARLDGNSGAVIYQNNYDFGSANNRATALVRDSTGNIASVGIALSGSVYEYHTQIFDSLGTQKSVNRESTGLTSITIDPRIVCDTIAHHFYVSGEKMKTTKDMLVYQITPGGNTTWRKCIDGQNSDVDASIGLAVNGYGVVYLCGLSKNSASNYDYTTVRITQTPVYYPIDFNNTNDPPSSHVVFYQNNGQLIHPDTTKATEVEYYTVNSSPRFYFRHNGLSFVNYKLDSATVATDSVERVDINFFHANENTETYRFDVKETGYLNYFKPHCGGATGITNVKPANRLMIPEIYPGVDLHYYSNVDGLKMYFVVKPYSSPNAIRMQFNGNVSTSLNGSNELSVLTSMNGFTFKTPKFYNVFATITGTNVTFTTTAIGGTMFASSSTMYGFNIGTYNNAMPLVIEIEQKGVSGTAGSGCDWSTYYGGPGFEGASKIITNALGESFIIGKANNAPFPGIVGGYSTTTSGYDGFLSKLSASGATLWGTYYGGNGTWPSSNFVPLGIGINGYNDIYVTGFTDDPNLPIWPSGNSVLQGTMDAAIARFNSTGNALLWARYLGGNLNDRANDLTIDYLNNVYIAGNTKSTSGFTLANPGTVYYQTSSSDNNSGFIARFTASNTMDWVTYFGGSGYDEIQSIKAKPNGAFLISGVTASSSRASSNSSNPPCGVPSINTYFPDCGGSPNYTQNYGGGNQDNFVAEFTYEGVLLWSTYYGGISDEVSAEIVTVPGYPNEFFLVGNTYTKNGALSTGPTGAYIQDYPSPSGTANWKRGYIAKFVNRQVVWHTLIGEGIDSYINEGIVDGNGNLYVTGKVQTSGYTTGATCTQVAVASQTDFPKCHPSGIFNQSAYGGGTYDAFIMGFKSNYTQVWSTFYGGHAVDEGISIAWDGVNNKICLIGNTTSKTPSLGLIPLYDPAIGNYQQNSSALSFSNSLGLGSNDRDLFLAKFCLNGIPIGIKENMVDNKDYLSPVYPNPNTGEFSVPSPFKQESKATYQIFDLSGRVIEKGTKDINDKNLNFNTGNKLSPGMYLLKLSSGQQQFTYKFMIE